MFKTLFKAMQIGEELKNPRTWKNRQQAVNAVAGLIALIVPFLPSLGFTVDISADDQIAIAGGIVAMVGVFNLVLTAATSKKVGLTK